MLVIDIETKSECSIKDAGALAYSLHPSTKVMCIVGQDTNSGHIERIDMSKGNDGFKARPLFEGQDFIAHNIAFERAIMENTLGWDMSSTKWVDTMDIAAYMGAPLSLAGAA